MPWCGSPFRAEGVRLNKYITNQCDKIRQVLQPGSFVLGCNLHFHFRPSESETTVLQKTRGDTTLQTKVGSAELYIKCLRGEPRGNFACNLQLSLWKNSEENFVKMSSQRFDGRPRFQFSATCKILSRGHPIHQRIVRACHLQHSMSVLVSATGCHPRPRHTAEIFKNQACTCLTKTRHRSAAFVP